MMLVNSEWRRSVMGTCQFDVSLVGGSPYLVEFDGYGAAEALERCGPRARGIVTGVARPSRPWAGLQSRVAGFADWR